MLATGNSITFAFSIVIYLIANMLYRGWLLYAPAIGSQIFNTLFGALYDREAERQGTHLCHGTACFRGTFLFGIGCALACLSVLAWAIVKMRLYRPTKLQ